MDEDVPDYCAEALASVGVKPDVMDADQAKTKQPKQADVLVALAVSGSDLFHDPDSTAYADVTIGAHRETWPVRTKGFKSWLAKGFFDATGGAANSEAMQTALAVIEAKALYDGDEHETAVRVGEQGGRI